MTGAARRRAWAERIVLLVRRCLPRHWSPRKRERRGLRESLILRLWDWLPGSTRPDLRAELEATLHDLRHRSKAKESSSPSTASNASRTEPPSTASNVSRAELPSTTSNASRAKPPSTSSHASLAERWMVLDGVRTLLRAWANEIAGSAGFHTPDLGHRRGLDEPPASGGRFQGIVQDLRHAVRVLSRAPAFTAVAVLTLGLGIGATTTFFTLVDGILLDPLPYADPDRLVKLKIARDAPAPGAHAYGESYQDLLDLRRDNRVFQSLAAFVNEESVLLAGDEPLRVDARFTEPELFALLGVPAALGRGLAPGDRDAIVLGHGLWRNHFGADREVIDRTVALDGRPYVVAGVMPPGYLVEGITPRNDLPKAWVSLESTTSESLDSRRVHTFHTFFHTFARLADGVTLEQAQQAMNLASARLHGESERDLRIWVAPLHGEVVGDAGPTLWLLLGAVGFLLSITCANVANLQLTRLSSRRRETAVRRALGAGRMRIVRQLLAESLTLGLLGGATGLLLAVAALRAFVAYSPGDLPRLEAVNIDLGVLGFTVGASLATGLLFGLAPALRGSSSNAAGALREGERGASGGGTASRRLRNGLLVGELALAVVLLAGAGLVINSFNYLRTYELGFEPANVLTFRLDLSGGVYDALGQRRDVQTQLALVRDFHRRLHVLLKELPGVEAVAGTAFPPADRRRITVRAFLEERPDEQLSITGRSAGGDYFDVLRLPLLAGRRFATDWRDGERTEVMVNAAAVRELWPGSSPQEVLGHRLKTSPISPWSEVVGVVGNIRHTGLDPEPTPEVIMPQGDTLSTNYYFLVRSHGDPLALVPAVREAVWKLDGELPVEEIRTLEQAIAATMARPRFYALLFSIFGALALTLAALGVVGVAAYTVAQRSREIGVRMALGASPASVLRAVLGQGLALVGLGITIGLGATLWLGRLLESFLYGLTSTDTATLLSVCVLLSLVALGALAVPARRAAAVDPIRALRGE